MAIDKYIERVYVTWAQAQSNLDAKHTCILSDQKNEHIHKIGSNFYFPAMSKYWDGSSWNYLDSEFDNLTVHSESTFESLPFVNITDSPTDDRQLITKSYADNLEASPAGTDGQLQYNNDGSFGAVSNFSNYISGTNFQINVTDSGNGVILSTPQDINETAAVIFRGVHIKSGTVTETILKLENDYDFDNTNNIKSYTKDISTNETFESARIELGSGKDEAPEIYDRSSHVRIKLYDEKISEITSYLSYYNKALNNNSSWTHPFSYITVTDSPDGFGGYDGFNILKMDENEDKYFNYDRKKSAKIMIQKGCILSLLSGQTNLSEASPDEVESALSTKRIFAELDSVDISSFTRKPFMVLNYESGSLPDESTIWGNINITDGRTVDFGCASIDPIENSHRIILKRIGTNLNNLYSIDRWGSTIPPSSSGSLTLYSDTYDLFGLFTENQTLEKIYGINSGLTSVTSDNYLKMKETYKTDGNLNNIYKKIEEPSKDASYIGSGFIGFDSKSLTPTEGLNSFGKYYIKNDSPYFVSSSGTETELGAEDSPQKYNFTLAFTSTPEDNEYAIMEGLVPVDMSITDLRISIFGVSSDTVDIGIYKRYLNSSNEFTETDDLITITELTNVAGASTAGLGGKFYSYTDGQLSLTTISEGELILGRVNSVTGTPTKIIFNLTCE